MRLSARLVLAGAGLQLLLLGALALAVLQHPALGQAPRETLTPLLLGAALSVPVFSALLWWIGETLARPLGQLTAATRAVGTPGPAPALPAGRHDEIGTLVEAFQAMSEEVQRKLEELTKNQEQQRKVLQDSRRRQRELETALVEAQAAARAKAEFLANMSHEVRTPLNAVLGFTQLLAASPLEARQADHVGRIRAAGKSLLRLIDDVLDLSKAEAGRLELALAPLDLRRLVHRVVELFSGQAERKQLVLQTQVDPQLAPWVVGDALRLHQVLVNLVGNAIKFTPRGSVQVMLECIDGAPDRQRVRIRVRDTGIGITTEHQAQIFSAFVQADSSITRRYGGTGLGLAICKNLVDLMGGTLAVDSQPGRGATFSVELDLPLASGPAPGGTDFDTSSDYATLSPAPQDAGPSAHSVWEDPVPDFEPTRPSDLPMEPSPMDREALEPLLQQLELRLQHNMLSAGQLLDAIRAHLGPAGSSPEFDALSRAVLLLRFPQALVLLARLRASIDAGRPR